MSGGAFTPGVRRIEDEPLASADFLASRNGLICKRGGMTIASALITADSNGDKIIKGGTVMVPLTGGPHVGKYAPFVPAAANGQGTVTPDVSGLLFPGTINVRHGDAVTGLMIAGSALAARVTGLDAAVRTGLAGRIIFQ